MTAPERIWLTNFHKDEYGAKLGRGVISDLDHGDNPDYPEYIRADLAHHIDTQDAEIKSLQTKLVLAHGQAEEALEVVATQDAKIKALVEALGKLCFEVAGLQAFEQGVRHEIGNTNYAAIMTRLEAGGVALAAAKDKPHE